jgi:hypothetical protein
VDVHHARPQRHVRGTREARHHRDPLAVRSPEQAAGVHVRPRSAGLLALRRRQNLLDRRQRSNSRRWPARPPLRPCLGTDVATPGTHAVPPRSADTREHGIADRPRPLTGPVYWMWTCILSMQLEQYASTQDDAVTDGYAGIEPMKSQNLSSTAPRTAKGYKSVTKVSGSQGAPRSAPGKL